MNYTIPVEICPVACKNPIVVFLEYIKTNTIYAGPAFNSTDDTQLAELNSEVRILLDEGFIINDNNCDNLCRPTCASQGCIQYMLSLDSSHLHNLINNFYNPSLPCCLNLISNADIYPYSDLSCNMSTTPCCNKFNYKLVKRLMSFVTNTINIDDAQSALSYILQFFVEFGTFENQSIVETILDELQTFSGYAPFWLLLALVENSVIVNYSQGSTIVMNFDQANRIC